MRLIHVCSKCKTEYDIEGVPFPEWLCPLCDQEINGNIAELKIKFRTGNSPMNKEEGNFLERMLEEECTKMGIKLEKVEWYGID